MTAVGWREDTRAGAPRSGLQAEDLGPMPAPASLGEPG
jgi:hypothetical protein